MKKAELMKFIFPLRMALGVAILLLLLQHIDFDVFLSLTRLQITAVCLVTIALVATTGLEAARLRSLCQNRFSYRLMVHVIFVATFITNFTPSTIGGDGYKILKMTDNKDYVGTTALILLERALGLSVLVAGSLIFAFALGGTWVEEYLAMSSTLDLSKYWTDLAKWILAGILLTTLVLAAIFRRVLVGVVRNFLQALFRLPAAALFKTLFFTTVFHTVKAALLCAVLAIIGLHLEFSQAWVVLAFTAIVSLLPLSIGGLGLREAAFVVALKPFAIAASAALFAGLIFRIMSILQAAIGGFLSTRSYSGKAV